MKKMISLKHIPRENMHKWHVSFQIFCMHRHDRDSGAPMHLLNAAVVGG